MTMRILCFESGGTKLVAAMSDSRGQVLQVKQRRRSAEQTAEETLEVLVDMGRELSEEEPPAAIGFGFGGTVDRDIGEPVACFHESGWESVRAGERLKKEFQVPVFIENDCNLAALAEAVTGYGIRTGTVFYVTVGTGIGGGIVKDGRLFTSGKFGEGEIGHLVVEPGGPKCPCGNRGCLETLCSGPGLSTLSLRLTGRSIDSHDLMDGLREEREDAVRIARAGAGYFSRALACVVNILAPSTIIFGGGVMWENRPYLELIREATLERMFPIFRLRTPEFLLSRLKEAVVCQGAALFALQKLAELEQKDGF